ncbi:RDD family protein [Microbacterium sp. ZW T5_56]|uniref:RDD family protein n=1 Tax=Microbacterium sp. ZW T5_56 TaxID=3378081 RepID=UPI003854C738
MAEKLCWACGRPMPADAAVCPHCRAPQQGAPAVIPAEGQQQASQAPHPPQAQQPSQPQLTRAQNPVQPAPVAPVAGSPQPTSWPQPAPVPAPAPNSARAHTRTRTRRLPEPASTPRSARVERPEINPDDPLGAAFSGSPAGVGRRLVALTIDALLIAAAGVLTAWLTSSGILGVVVAAEVALIFVVIEARTGASAGKLVMRVRVAQEHAPRSPGLGRAVVRALTTLAGGLVAVVGAWGVELTALADRTGRRRSLGDRAAGTVVVALPDRGVPAAAAVEPHSARATSVLPAADAGFAALETTGATTGGSGSTGDTGEQMPSSAEPRALPVRGDGMGALEATGRVAPGGVLLIFDTGQRELLPARAVANLGRTPSASVEGDLTVRVDDPSRTISKNHVRLEQARSGAWVTDLGSTNGTSLIREDGSATPLRAGERVAVDDGVRVRMGDRWFSISRLMEEDS